MAKFEIQQDYTLIGTHYYEVEADTLEAAIEIVEAGKIESFKDRTWDDLEDGYTYDDSFEYTTSDEWVKAGLVCLPCDDGRHDDCAEYLDDRSECLCRGAGEGQTVEEAHTKTLLTHPKTMLIEE